MKVTLVSVRHEVLRILRELWNAGGEAVEHRFFTVTHMLKMKSFFKWKKISSQSL
jgi:hypothetical protein